MKKLFFWQILVSPHMVSLAAEMINHGYQVYYMAEEEMNEERRGLGWSVNHPEKLIIKIVKIFSEVEGLVQNAGPEAIHICQGVRSNGWVGRVQDHIAKCGYKYYVVMETVEEKNRLGFLKKIIYKWNFAKKNKNILGVLANGYKTREWVIDRGVFGGKVFDFAYFLAEPSRQKNLITECKNIKYKFIYVGQLIKRKRVDFLLNALAELDANFELLIVGSGQLEGELKSQADNVLPGKVKWRGVVDINAVPDLIADSDCLILPSRHDGWGAVISEALMVGTPVICSDTCGAAGVVFGRHRGGVFKWNQMRDLIDLLKVELDRGKVSVADRELISLWAHCLGVARGASYLNDILKYKFGEFGDEPNPPWKAVN